MYGALWRVLLGFLKADSLWHAGRLMSGAAWFTLLLSRSTNWPHWSIILRRWRVWTDAQSFQADRVTVQDDGNERVVQLHLKFYLWRLHANVYHELFMVAVVWSIWLLSRQGQECSETEFFGMRIRNKLVSLHPLAHGLKLFVLICMLFEVGIYGHLGHLRPQKIPDIKIVYWNCAAEIAVQKKSCSVIIYIISIQVCKLILFL